MNYLKMWWSANKSDCAEFVLFVLCVGHAISAAVWIMSDRDPGVYKQLNYAGVSILGILAWRLLTDFIQDQKLIKAFKKRQSGEQPSEEDKNEI